MENVHIIEIVGLERFKKIDPRCLVELKKLPPDALFEALKHGIIVDSTDVPKAVEQISFGKLESFARAYLKAITSVDGSQPHWFSEPDPDGFAACYNEMMGDVSEDWRLSQEGIFFRSRCRMLWILCEAAQHDKIRKFKDSEREGHTPKQKALIEKMLDFMEHTKTELPPAPKVEVQKV